MRVKKKKREKRMEKKKEIEKKIIRRPREYSPQFFN
jgi:hypothetical protein